MVTSPSLASSCVPVAIRQILASKSFICLVTWSDPALSAQPVCIGIQKQYETFETATKTSDTWKLMKLGRNPAGTNRTQQEIRY